jgi:tetratricopeptide (TPR) repeat protein
MSTLLKREITAGALVVSLMTGIAYAPANFTPAAFAQSSDVMRQAVELYSQGRLEEAAQLLQRDLREHPDSGVAHQYMGKILEKQGYDKQALQEFEMAFRLIPQGVVDAGIKTAAQGATGKTISASASQTPAANWFETMWNNAVDSTTRFFGGTPAPRPTTSTGSSSGFDLNSDPSTSMPFWLPIAMPNLAENIKKLYKDGRKRIINLVHKQGEKNTPSGWHPYKSISMADLEDIVEKCQKMDTSKWASHDDRIRMYPSTPPDSREWDFWISRYRRAFQFILLHHLEEYAKDETRGATSIVFSVDKNGRLRGCIFATTSNDNLNRCLLETIRDLNGSRILKFPANPPIEGWNFTMSWDFRRMLAIVKARREAREKLLAMQNAKEDAFTKLSTDASVLAQKMLVEARAEQQKLRLAKLEESLVRKTEVSATIVQPAKPVELRATALKLSDVLMKDKFKRGKGDAFKNIDDRQIMSWPDISN